MSQRGVPFEHRFPERRAGGAHRLGHCGARGREPDRSALLVATERHPPPRHPTEVPGARPGVADKARRFRLLLDAYGIERDLSIVHAGIDRARQMLEHQLEFAARGSAWEVELAHRGLFDEAELEIAWVEEHAVALVES